MAAQHPMPALSIYLEISADFYNTYFSMKAIQAMENTILIIVDARKASMRINNSIIEKIRDKSGWLI